MADPRTPEQALDLLERWGRDPVAFVREALGDDPDEWQAKALRDSVTSDRMAIRSGHGVGKSFFVAWRILHFICTRFPCKIPVTGANFDQLKATLWSEVGAALARLQARVPQLGDELEYNSEKLCLRSRPTESFAILRTASAGKEQGLAGFHSANVLLVIDEASAVSDAVFEVLGGALTTAGSKLLMTGNPSQASGYFFDAFNKRRALFCTRHISCVDVPRVSRAWIEEQALAYGRESNVFRVRVLGEFPLQDADGVIPLDLLESAVGRDVATLDVAPIWGLDPARFGDDRSALCKRQGNAVLEPVMCWQGLDGAELAGRVVQQWLDAPPPLRPQFICVDTIGVGASAYDYLKRTPQFARGETRIVSVNVAETAARSDKYSRLRDELWFKARDWFGGRDCKICDDAVLIGELAGPRYEITPAGKLQVESKDSMKRRGLRSPDVADAFVMTFAASAQPAREASGFFGQALVASQNWNAWGERDDRGPGFSAWRS